MPRRPARSARGEPAGEAIEVAVGRTRGHDLAHRAGDEHPAEVLQGISDREEAEHRAGSATTSETSHPMKVAPILEASATKPRQSSGIRVATIQKARPIIATIIRPSAPRSGNRTSGRHQGSTSLETSGSFTGSGACASISYRPGRFSVGLAKAGRKVGFRP